MKKATKLTYFCEGCENVVVLALNDNGSGGHQEGDFCQCNNMKLIQAPLDGCVIITQERARDRAGTGK